MENPTVTPDFASVFEAADSLKRARDAAALASPSGSPEIHVNGAAEPKRLKLDQPAAAEALQAPQPVPSVPIVGTTNGIHSQVHRVPSPANSLPRSPVKVALATSPVIEVQAASPVPTATTTATTASAVVVPTPSVPVTTPSVVPAPAPVAATTTNDIVIASPELVQHQLRYCATILKNMKRLKDVGPFLKPVDPIALGIPTYFDIIKDPMDISTIQSKLDSQKYPSFKEFEADVNLMLGNCFKFNAPASVVFLMGKNVEKSFVKMMEKMPTEIQKKRQSIGSVSDSRPKRDIVPPSLHSPSNKKRVPSELRFCGQVLREVMSKAHVAVNFAFMVPVDPIALGIPHYFDIIKHPMDLSTIKKKLDSGAYGDCDDFEDDFRQMLNNCFTFNHPGDDVYELGKKMERLFDSLWSKKPIPGMPFSGSLSAPKVSGSVSVPKRKSELVSDGSSDEEYDNQQIALLQQNLALMSGQLSMLMEKKRRRKEKRKSLGIEKKKDKQNGLQPDLESLPEMSFEQKRELSEKINNLPPEKVMEVFQIIREGLPSLGEKENQEEIELDINSLDKKTIYRLYDFVKKSSSSKPAASAPAPQVSSGSESSGSDSE